MAEEVKRSKISLFNAITAMSMTLVNGLLGLVVTKMIIDHYGSDFNGLNSAANQIINVLLILEGGFTLATNIALFSPLTEGDYDRVNRLLTTTRRKFQRIGCIFLLVGCAVSLGYALVINSGLSTELVFTIIMMALVPAAFNLFFATTYRVLLQAQQKEYIINLLTMLTLAMGYGANIVVIIANGPMWMIRLGTMASALINSFLIAWYVKRHNKYLHFYKGAPLETIYGTRDVMIQKITGVVYNSVPIVFLSISPSGGTILASVYAVYNNVFIMIKSLLRGVIDAPRLGLGQMLTQEKREKIWRVFAQYEYAAFLLLFIIVNTAYVLILPFVALYTEGVTDANYYDTIIALLMTLITAFEMIHIPSGNLINMAGEFRVSRNFQIIACVVLVLAMLLGGSLLGVYGVLLAILLVAMLLAVMEISFVHFRFFSGRWKQVLRMLLPLVGAAIGTCWFGSWLFASIQGIGMFLVAGCCLVALNAVIVAIVSLIFNRAIFVGLIRRALSLRRS